VAQNGKNAIEEERPQERNLCCHQILFNQPDFQAQKPALFELVEANGHIALFYPKFPL